MYLTSGCIMIIVVFHIHEAIEDNKKTKRQKDKKTKRQKDKKTKKQKDKKTKRQKDKKTYMNVKLLEHQDRHLHHYVDHISISDHHHIMMQI